MMIKKSFLLGLLASCLLLGCGNDDGTTNTQDDDGANPPEIENPPVDDPPVDDPPVDDPPVDDPPVDDPPVDDPPVDDPPVDDPPVDDPPVDDPPVDDPPVEEPEKIACTHDVCSIDYQDVLDGNAENLGLEYLPCIEGFLGEVQSCPDNQVCIDGGCMDSFVIGDKEACKIDPNDEFTLAYENDHGQCTANGNYSVVCRYGKITVRSCKQPCEMAYDEYARCPQTEEGSSKEFFDHIYCDAYDALTDEEKAAYQKMYEAILEAKANGESEATFENIYENTIDNAEKAISHCLYGYPVAWYSSSGYASKDDPNLWDSYTRYFHRTVNDPKREQDLQNIVFEILEPTDALETDIEKEMYIHNWMAEHILYKANEDDQTVYGGLVRREAVCAGYSATFKYLMDRLMIPTWIISGIAVNNEGPGPHAWNIIQINGEYYNIDVTWDRFASYDLWDNKVEPYIRYTYFNRTDAFFSKDHTRDKEFSNILSCNSLAASFEALLGIDAIAKVINEIYSYIGGTIVTSIDEYYDDMKTKLNIEIEQNKLTGNVYHTQQISIVLGKDVINQIEKLKLSERNAGYLDEVVSKINYKCYGSSVVTFFDMLGDRETIAFVNTTHSFQKK